METIYLIMVIVLFTLAISDLIVGVSNDAVNFLNSAIGAKAASFKTIMIIAGLGVLIGATFSSGMMEIARSGVFHPQKFFFHEIMLIFLAVMITDVILLDIFNTYGLPTSTTVSIVFELLGAGVAIAMMKVINSDDPTLSIGQFINSSKALAIISGILLSVVIAFSFGALIQFVTRTIFSFNYHKRLKSFGSIFGGIAITAIVYFMLIKGLKGASLITPEMSNWISNNSLLILGICFIGFTFVLQVLYWLFKINILKIIVLTGTFALAMAFAGNDLVNFIGVPLAGLESYFTLVNTAGATPDTLLMESLQGAVETPTYFLLIAGVVMVITLFSSKKAQNVIKTTVNLSRQDEGQERFGSTPLSRSIVRASIGISESVEKIIPKSIQKKIEKQFVPLPKSKNEEERPAFDMLRAAINLVVASALIALGTSLKLPLSTTYVTFMVAMGTSLSDKAWDRESAVFRVTGVFSVIGGWFFTAISAFTLTFIMGLLFYFGSFYAIGIMCVVAIVMMIRTHKMQKSKEQTQMAESLSIEQINNENIIQQSTLTISTTLQQVHLIFRNAIAALINFDPKIIKKTSKNAAEISQKTKYQKDHIATVISKLKDDTIDSGQYYVQTLDYLREITHSLNFVVAPIQTHIDNNHKELSVPQLTELKTLSNELSKYLTKIITEVTDKNFSERDNIADEQQKLLSVIDLFRKNEIKRIKKENGSTRNSLLFINILQEIKNLCLFSLNLYKSERDFVVSQNEKKEFDVEEYDNQVKRNENTQPE